MQDKVYKSDEVKMKLADLLVSLKPFYDADSTKISDMLEELEEMLDKMNRNYLPDLWNEVYKHLNKKKENT